MAPFIYQVDSLSITAIEGNSVDLSCYLLVGFENNPYENLTWTWSFKSYTNNISNSGNYQIATNPNASSTLTIKSISGADKGDYICTVSDIYGYHSRTISLRVKSERFIK